MSDDSIVNRIKALRAKVNNAASTEAEVEAAARMVAKLMTQHDIDESQLKESDFSEALHAKTDVMKNDINEVVRYCWSGIEALTETKSWRGEERIHYVGLDHDVEMALYLYELITMSAKRGWLRYSAKLFDEKGMMRTKGARASYYVGFGQRMNAMLMQLHRERQSARDAWEDVGTTSGGTALVVRKDNIIKSKMKEMGIRIYKSRSNRRSHIDGDAFKAGNADASRVNLNRPFGSTKAAGRIA